MSQENERREFVRVPFRTGTTVRTANRTIWASSALDLSMNGIRIMTSDEPPALGAFCEVEMVLSEADPPVIIEARGTVVRSVPGTIAVHFSEVDLESYQHLREIILNNAGSPEDAELQLRAHWGIRKPAR